MRRLCNQTVGARRVASKCHCVSEQEKLLDAMDSDDEMEVDGVIPSALKGKEKALDIVASSDGDTLPWSVPFCAS